MGWRGNGAGVGGRGMGVEGEWGGWRGNGVDGGGMGMGRMEEECGG